MFGKKKKAEKTGPEPMRGYVEQGTPPPPPTHQSVSKWYIVLSVFYVILGIIMVAWQKATVDLVGIVLGTAMLAYGIARIIIYFTKSHFEGIVHMDLTVGVVVGALGAFLLLHRDFVNTAFPFAVAIILLIGAISKLQYSIDMKRLGVVRHKVFLVFSVIISRRA